MPLARQPVDDEGITLPHDHPELLNADFVIRLIPEHWRAPAAAAGLRRLSSQTFENSSDKYEGCSILISKLLAEAGQDVAAVVRQRGMVGAVELSVGTIRSHGLIVGFDPLADDPFHGQIWNKISRGTSKKLLSACSWSVEIPDTLIREP